MLWWRVVVEGGWWVVVVESDFSVNLWPKPSWTKDNISQWFQRWILPCNRGQAASSLHLDAGCFPQVQTQIIKYLNTVSRTISFCTKTSSWRWRNNFTYKQQGYTRTIITEDFSNKRENHNFHFSHPTPKPQLFLVPHFFNSLKKSR